LFDALFDTTKNEMDKAQNEVNQIIKLNKEFQHIDEYMTPTDILIEQSKFIELGVIAMVKFVKNYKIVYQYIIAGLTMYNRLINEKDGRKQLAHYTRMPRLERLKKLNKLVFEEGFRQANVSVNEHTINQLAEMSIQIYENLIDGVPSEIVVQETLNNIEKKLVGCALIRCREPCNDVHIAIKVKEGSELIIIKYGRVASVDMVYYASNKNFSAIAIMSSLEYSTLFGMKSVTRYNTLTNKILDHDSLTVVKQKICEGLIKDVMYIQNIEPNRFTNMYIESKKLSCDGNNEAKTLMENLENKSYIEDIKQNSGSKKTKSMSQKLKEIKLTNNYWLKQTYTTYNNINSKKNSAFKYTNKEHRNTNKVIGKLMYVGSDDDKGKEIVTIHGKYEKICQTANKNQTMYDNVIMILKYKHLKIVAKHKLVDKMVKQGKYKSTIIV